MISTRSTAFAGLLATLCAPCAALATEPVPSSAPTTADSAAMPAETSAAPAATPETSSAPAPAAPVAVAVVARPPMRRWFVHLNVGVPVYTTIGPWVNPTGGNVGAQSFTPDQRFILVQLIGAGYWVHPHIRLTLSLQFAETLTSQPVAMPAGATTLTGLTFMSGIAWAAFTWGPVFAGLGVMAGPRWMGNSAHNWAYGDIGIFTCVGASVPLGSGFALGLAVQMPVTFNPAINFTIVPALSLGRRF
ncbi:MAG: hypothetical protein WCJ30_00915 [Deltaproteobacteria bacterium]